MPTTITQFSRELNAQANKIESMLPPGLNSRRFMRTVVNMVSTHAHKDRLLNADRQSLFNACQKAAGDGLMLDGREATLIVFKNNKKRMDEVSYIPMVQGLVKLARNSGEIASITAELVYSADEFQYRPGIDQQPVHDPNWFGDRGVPIGVYAVVGTKDNEKIVSVMPQKRIMEIAGVGRNGDQFDPARGVNFVEWWKKTAIKNVLKYAPKSTYLESAMNSDNSSTGYDPVEKPVPGEVLNDINQVREAIDGATSKEALFGLQDMITELPVEHQEVLVIHWNERASQITNEEQARIQSDKKAGKKSAARNYAVESHVVDPQTGEIIDDDVA